MFFFASLIANTEFVSAMNSNNGQLVIPNGICNVGDKMFYRNTTISEIVIPDSVQRIGKSSFSNCTNVTSIHLGDGLKEIDDNAFEGLTKVRDLVIPASVTRIGKNALKGMNLRLLYVVNQQCRIESDNYNARYINRQELLGYPAEFNTALKNNAVLAFQAAGVLDKNQTLTQKAIDEAKLIMYWDQLTNPTAKRAMVDENINGKWCKYETQQVNVDGCENPVTIHFYMDQTTKKLYLDCDFKIKICDPNKSKGGQIKHDQSSKTKAIDSKKTMPDGKHEPSFKKKEFKQENKHKVTTKKPELTKLDLPNDITEIGENQYQSIEQELVIIPAKIKSIGDMSFFNCKKLKEVHIYKADIGSAVFYNCEQLTKIDIKEGVRSIGDNSFSLNYDIGLNGNYGPDFIKLPDTLVSIGNACFANLKAVNKVSLGTNLTSIGSNFMYSNDHCRFKIRDGEGKETVKQLLIEAGVSEDKIND